MVSLEFALGDFDDTPIAKAMEEEQQRNDGEDDREDHDD